MEALKRRIENEDALMRERGGPTQQQKEEWGITTNIGFWIIGKQTGAYLRNLIREKQPKQILEIGTSVGYSTLWLAEGAKECGAKIDTIEIEEFKAKMALKHFKEANVDDIIAVHVESFEETAKHWREKIDVLFLDANKNGYLKAFQLFEPYLSPRAIVVADNVIDMRDRLQNFLHHMQNHPDFDTEILPMDHGLLVARKKA